jgi:hypothetical protein
MAQNQRFFFLQRTMLDRSADTPANAVRSALKYNNLTVGSEGKIFDLFSVCYVFAKTFISTGAIIILPGQSLSTGVAVPQVLWYICVL